MKEITVQDLRAVREKAQKSSTATVVTGDIVHEEEVKAEKAGTENKPE